MNKHIFYRSELHKWIVDEWNKINRPSVIFVGIGGTGHMRLWKHECGKQFIVFDIGRTSES